MHDQVRAQRVAHEHGRRGQTEVSHLRHHSDKIAQERLEGVPIST